MSEAAKHTGGCQCGAVRYALLENPTAPGICHCRMCQKALGAPFGAFTGLPKTALVWTRGNPATFRSSSTSERGFCATCGTPLTYALTESERISVSLFTLDEPAAVAPPDRQIGMEARAKWLDDINTFPAKTTGEDSGQDFIDSCVSFQHPDHDTPADWTPHSQRTDG